MATDKCINCTFFQHTAGICLNKFSTEYHSGEDYLENKIACTLFQQSQYI